MDIAAASKPTTVTYNVDENGNGTGAWNAAPAKLPPHLAKRMAAAKKLRKKGTPAEREAAVERRRQAVLEEKKNKARKHIEQCAGYAENKKAMVAALAAQEAAVAAQDGGESSQEAKK